MFDEYKILNELALLRFNDAQGGIDDSEDPKVAALRELKEETGVSSAEVLAEVCFKMSFIIILFLDKWKFLFHYPKKQEEPAT